MAEDVKLPMRRVGLSSLCLQEKKGRSFFFFFFHFAQLVSVALQAGAGTIQLWTIVLSSSFGQCSQCGSGSHLGTVQLLSNCSAEGKSDIILLLTGVCWKVSSSVSTIFVNKNLQSCHIIPTKSHLALPL